MKHTAAPARKPRSATARAAWDRHNGAGVHADRRTRRQRHRGAQRRAAVAASLAGE